ncbi:MAG: TlpA family protein disulfide reductase [Acidobacteriota bacterium]
MPPRAFDIGFGAAAASRPELRPATADDVLHEVQIRGGRVTLVNVWATWCGPCVEEMPGILKLHNQLALRGMELILVSGDFHGKEDQVVEFLAGRGVDFPSFIKDGDDQAFINGMNTLWTGALPASFLYSADGKQIDFWEGTISYAELKDKLLRILDAA